ncbi:MAG: HDOD domain-containing protein [Acidobacteria bacterium]|nr:HDOD domain-containing protein [Acidobacteriota bacterium]
MAKSISQLPAFSPVAVRLMTMLGQEDLRYREVAEILQVDAALTTGLLRLANTAMVGSRYPVSSVMQAVALLGVERVSALVATLSLGSFLGPVTKMPVFAQFWRHNLATALAATVYAQKLNMDTDQAYLHGLLHDIGRLGMLMAFRDQYAALYSNGAEDLVSRERERFGFDHVQAGGWLAILWNLPPAIAEPSVTDGSPLLAEFACNAATTAGYGILPPPDPLPELEPGSPESNIREFLNERVTLYEKAYGLTGNAAL